VTVARGKSQNQLVEQHLSLVQAIARKLKKTVTARIDFEDLVAYGSKGLVEAAERFDPAQGVAFTTFAYYRIRGAMFDGLRTMGWYSRSDYARYRAEERANELLRAQAEREGAERVAARAAGAAPAKPDDTAAALAAIGEMLAKITTVHITSLEAASAVVDERLPGADVQLDTGRMGTRVRGAIQTLPERERRLMELYYFADKNLEEAGAELGLSKSWACRIHARAIDMLRDALDAEPGGEK
jgi:RNA polymerase sigma factor for flagellar operon FliA